MSTREFNVTVVRPVWEEAIVIVKADDKDKAFAIVKAMSQEQLEAKALDWEHTDIGEIHVGSLIIGSKDEVVEAGS